MNDVTILQQSRPTFYVAVHVFLLKDSQLLMARRFQTGYEDGNYSVPAGHLEIGETPKQAAIREAEEEVGVLIRPENLHFVHVMHRIHDRQSVDFFFSATQWYGDPRLNEPDKCDHIQWVELDRLPMNTIPYIRLAAAALRENQLFSETDC